jgi:hypothetical protein
MAYADLISADAIAAIALVPLPWTVEWMDVLIGAVGAALLVAAWFPASDPIAVQHAFTAACAREEQLGMNISARRHE